MITQENIPYTADEIKAMVKTCEKYNKALERAKDMLAYKEVRQEDMEYLFPELAESKSKDEMIRQCLIEHIKCNKDLNWSLFQWFKPDTIISWLEKQGENKSVDKPKFKVGDWITDGHLTCKVLSVTGKFYELHLYNDDYCHFETDVQSVDKRYHLWSINDAKDGDVLVAKDDRPFIFTGEFDVQDDNPTAYCGINSSDKFITGMGSHWTFKDGIKPATKEQQDLLFAKMKEAGYEWDAQKKELKKIEQKTVDKTEPKFKVRDWILNDVCFPLQIASIRDGMYVFTEGDAISVSFVDEHLHLWTIQDAKDGDVLVDSYSKDSLIILYKGINKEQSILAHCGWNGYNFSIKTNGLGYGGLDNTNYLPATKEQRDLLFSKMKEAGCEWDAEKKELKKIEVVSKESEDERIRKTLIEHIKGIKSWNYFLGISKEQMIAWLEKQGEPKDKEELAKGLLIQVATSIMNWLDANTTKGEKCLSNMECEDIETAVRNADWNKVYAYMKKKLEKSALSYRDIDKKVDELVDEFSHTEIGGYGRPGPIEIDAYRKGMNDAIRSIYEYNKIQI